MAKRNEYEQIRKDEVEERINYERALAKAFAALWKTPTMEDFDKLGLTDDTAKATAFTAVNFKYRTWENFEKLGLTNEIAKAMAFAALKDNYKSWGNFENLNLTDEMAKAKAIPMKEFSVFDTNVWENFNKLALNNEMAKATAFAALPPISKTWENFKNLNLTKDMAKATAFAGLSSDEKTWERFKDLNLTEDMAKATAFAGLQPNDRTLEHFSQLKLENEMAKATAFAGLNKGKEWNNFQNFILNQLTNEEAIAKAFAGLSIDRNWENFNALKLTNEMAKATAFAALSESETKGMKEFDELKLTNPKAKAVAFGGLDFNRTIQNFKKIFEQRNRARTGGGVALGILCTCAVSLALLHVFCPPAAGIIDGVLAAIGIKTGTGVIAAAVVNGVIGLASGISSGLLFWNSKEIPKANKKVKEQIQKRNQESQSIIENSENTEQKTSVLGELIPNAIDKAGNMEEEEVNDDKIQKNQNNCEQKHE